MYSVFKYTTLFTVEVVFLSDTNTGSAFMVLGKSGVITVNGSLDRETKSSYALRVGVSRFQI